MKLFQKFGWNSLGQFSQLLFSLLIIPLILNNFEDDVYGKFVFLSHILAIMSLFDLGRSLKVYVDSSSSDFTKENLRDDYEKYLGISFWIVVFSFLYSSIISYWGSLNLTLLEVISISLVAVSMWPRSIFRGLLLGFNMERRFNCILALSNLVRIFPIYFLPLLYEISFANLCLILLFFNTFEIIIFQLMVRLICGLEFNWKVENLSDIWSKNDFRLYSLLGQSMWQLPFLWVSVTVGEDGLSYLGLLVLPITALTTLMYPLTTSLTNIFSQHRTLAQSVNYLSAEKFKILLLIGCPAVLSLFIYDLWFFKIIDASVEIPSYLVFIIMVGSGCLFTAGNITSIFLVSHRYMYYLNICHLIAIAVILILLVFSFHLFTVYFFAASSYCASLVLSVLFKFLQADEQT